MAEKCCKCGGSSHGSIAGTMTREEMARGCEEALQVALESVVDYSGMTARVKAAADELRKTCATCQHWRDPHDTARTNIGVSPWCSLNGGIYPLPIDGSGFCHRWESQPAGKAQD